MRDGIGELRKLAESVGSSFSGWNGACAGTGTCTVAANGIVNVGAVFALVSTGGGGGGGTAGGGGAATRKLVVKSSGGKGVITSSPVGINCGLTCTASVASGSVFSLLEVPDAGFRFVNWSGACTGTNPICTVTVTADTTAQANFVKQ